MNTKLVATGAAVLAALLVSAGLAVNHSRLHPVIGPAGGSTARHAATTPPEPKKTVKTVTVASGDTLLGILSAAGVDAVEADGLVAAIAPLFGPPDLQPGQTIDLSLTEVPGAAIDRLAAIQIAVDSTKDIVATFVAADEWSVRVVPQKVTFRPNLVSGEISTSLYEAAQTTGLPLSVLMEMIRAYSFDVDFQRDVHPGDTFEVVFDRIYDSRGNYLSEGKMLFAALTLGGERQAIYEHATAKGYVDYFNGSGQSVRKMLMRTPVQGAWISSVFGWRKSPINGYSEFHRGLDFAAPVYTPIMAAGNGTVVVAGHSNDYGNYIQLQHANGYQTLYAHMIAFARGVHVGTVVSQGQVIGYVGTTGMSTGPHLHYEVIYLGERINPATIVSPIGPVLSGAALRSFLKAKEGIDEQYAALKADRPVPVRPGHLAETPQERGLGNRG